MADFSRLTRPAVPMPQDVAERLSSEGLTEAYRARPPYQQNDWLRWIEAAKRPATREKRISEMLSDLRAGDRYMKMSWRPQRGKVKPFRGIPKKSWF